MISFHVHVPKGSKGYFDHDKFTCLPDQFLFFACAKPSCLNSWTMSDSPVCWLGVIRQNLFCWSPNGLILVKTIQFQDHKLEFQDHILSFHHLFNDFLLITPLFSGSNWLLPWSLVRRRSSFSSVFVVRITCRGRLGGGCDCDVRGPRSDHFLMGDS